MVAPHEPDPGPFESSDTMDVARDAALESSLIQQSRERGGPEDVREHTSIVIGAVASVATTAALLFTEAPTLTLQTGFTLLTAIAVYAVASSIEFEIGPASAVPTQPALIAMLFTLPPSLVPVAVTAALLLGGVLINARTGRQEPWSMAPSSAFHSIGPAAVALVVGVPSVRSHQWLLLAALIPIQLLFDLTIAAVRNCYGLGLSFSVIKSAVRWTYAVDIALAPAGLLAAQALGATPWTFLSTLSLSGLLYALAADRERKMQEIAALSTAWNYAQVRARMDALTGLGNRLAWNEALQLCNHDADEPVSVVALDVDRLKPVNDRYGHEAGDHLIRTIGTIIAEIAPPGSTSCRLGGDEFAVLLPGPLAGIHQSVAQAIATEVADQPPTGDIPMSVSVGSAIGAGREVEELVKRADEALYEHKRSRPGVARTASDPASDPLHTR